jgi:acetyl esterase/lipase
MVLSALTATVLASCGGVNEFRGWVGLAAIVVANVFALAGLIRFRRNIVSLDPPLSLTETAASRYPRTHSVFPFMMWHRAGVRRTRGITYASPDGVDLKLDVYEPSAPAQRLRPAVIYVHGGGLMTGSRRQGVPLLTHLAANGWVAISIDYRLSPRATFPDHLVDVKRAIEWVREHAGNYHLDPTFVAIAGGSAGAHLSALAALTPGDERLPSRTLGADTSVSALVGLYGLYDLLDQQTYWPRLFNLFERWVFKTTLRESPGEYRWASPTYHDQRDAPPTLIVFGDRDSLVPAVQSQRFVKRLREESQKPVYSAQIPGGQHAFDLIPSWRTIGVVEVIERFLFDAYQRHQVCAGSDSPPLSRPANTTNTHQRRPPTSPDA